jgi:acetyltransferase EpsM
MNHNTPPPLVLIGAGGHGRDVLDAAQAQGRSVVGFLDDQTESHGRIINGLPVLGPISWSLEHKDVRVCIAIDNPFTKKKVADFLEKGGISIAAPIIHPAASVSRNAIISDGAVILAGSAIQPQVVIGRHACISTVNTIGHDTKVEDFVSTHPGAQVGGETILALGCFIGLGASILPRIKIGQWAVIGAGAAVTTDIPAFATAVGVPARVIKRREE